MLKGDGLLEDEDLKFDLCPISVEEDPNTMKITLSESF
jgi:hypothetical protein